MKDDRKIDFQMSNIPSNLIANLIIKCDVRDSMFVVPVSV